MSRPVAVSVRRNQRGAWCVVLRYPDGTEHAVSDHRTPEAARIAAQRHIASPPRPGAV
jgi:hypothetical protein